jgi:DeoR/GlpR family transcriptional regulator of sugar metabolism
MSRETGEISPKAAGGASGKCAKQQAFASKRDVILGRLAQGQSVVAAALALEFEVSEDAICRDLRALAAEGRCRRVYGGALPLSKATAPMAARMEEARDRKQALARRAASVVKPGQFVFLDSGSTNLALVSCLPEDFELTIATNSIDIAAALRRSDLRLIMVGGAVNYGVSGCVDAPATLSLMQVNIDLGVLGACAVSFATGLSAYDFSDAAFKRALLAASRKHLVSGISRVPHSKPTWACDSAAPPPTERKRAPPGGGWDSRGGGPRTAGTSRRARG